MMIGITLNVRIVRCGRGLAGVVRPEQPEQPAARHSNNDDGKEPVRQRSAKREPQPRRVSVVASAETDAYSMVVSATGTTITKPFSIQAV